MVREKPLGDVFAVHVCLHVLSRVSLALALAVIVFPCVGIMLILNPIAFAVPMCSVMLWAPFLNFRKFPRDPSMKYPWSTPQDPTQVKNAFLKYPFAKPEDYR